MFIFKWVPWVIGALFFPLLANAGCGQPGSVGDLTINVGNLHIPRDAPIGSVLGEPNQMVEYTTAPLQCWPVEVLHHVVTAQTVSGINVAGISMDPLRVIKTNIDGVGAVVKTSNMPSEWGAWKGSYPYFPYVTRLLYSSTTWSGIRYYVTLVKIGKISRNDQQFGRQLLGESGFSAWDENGTPTIFSRLYLEGSVTRDECSMATPNMQGGGKN